MEVLKAHVNAGLVPRRSNGEFDEREYDGYFEAGAAKSEKIRMLIRAGVYNIDRPGIVDVIAADWYKTPGAKTPERIVQEERRRKNSLPKKQMRPKCPMQQRPVMPLPKAIQDAKRPATKAKRMTVFLIKKSGMPTPASTSSPVLKEPTQRYMPKIPRSAASRKVSHVTSKLVQGAGQPRPSKIMVI